MPAIARTAATIPDPNPNPEPITPNQSLTRGINSLFVSRTVCCQPLLRENGETQPEYSSTYPDSRVDGGRCAVGFMASPPYSGALANRRSRYKVLSGAALHYVCRQWRIKTGYRFLAIYRRKSTPYLVTRTWYCCTYSM